MVFAKAKSKSFNEIYVRASAYCAYQERTQQEVREKLYGQKVDKDMVEEIIARLVSENFLSEERFAKAYAGGKFRMKKWGRLKIIQGLKRKGVSTYCINKGLGEISEEEYEETLKELLTRRMREEKEKDLFKKKFRLASFVIRKGYESELVWEILETLFR